ncbi:MAG: DUF6178 family protein [Pseudomonadota bacterium]
MSSSKTPAPALSTSSQVRQQLLSLPPSKRVDHLIGLPNVRQILKRLCPQDLVIALHAAGIADSLELVELLPPSQVQCILDLETWHRDRIEPRALASWLSVLFAANPERAMAQVVGLDADLVTLYIKLYTRVYDLGLEPEPEPMPEQVITTPDNRYLVTFVAPPHPGGRGQPDPTDELGAAVARKIVEGLIAREPFTASRYLEAVRWELPSELEESSLRWRSGRLADLGYADLYEAQIIYAPIDLNRPPRVRAVDVIPDPDEPDTALALFVEENAGAPLLRAASDRLSGAEHDRVRRQLTALCNKVAAAQALSPGDIEALTGAVHEAVSTVNLGLEYLSKGELGAAAECLVDMALADVFRVGNSVVSQLARKARAVLRSLRIDEQRSLLSPAAEDVFTALTQRFPRLHAGLVHPGQVGRQPFESLAQLARAAEFVADVGFVSALLLDVLGFSPHQRASLLQGACNVGEPDEVHLDLILATAVARVLVGGTLDPAPLVADELRHLRTALLENRQAAVKSAVEALLRQAMPHLPLPGAPSMESVQQRTQRWCEVLVERLHDELGPIQDSIDPRFVTAVLCRVD